MRHFKNQAGFTLIELLTVVVIIGLMLAIAVPSINRITQGNSLNNGTRQFSDQVAMARTYALVNAQNVYLVVAYSGTVNAGSNYCYTAYGFCVSAVNPLLAIQPSGGPLSQVNYIDAIQSLPAGVVFSDSPNPQPNNVAIATVPFPSSNSAPVQVWCVEFNQFGQCSLPSGTGITLPACQTPLTCPPQFSLIQGFVNTSATPTPQKTYPGINTLTINPLIGKVTVSKTNS